MSGKKYNLAKKRKGERKTTPAVWFTLRTLSLFVCLVVFPPLLAQQPDTTASRKTLPEIQLQEYTIVGLERIRLPEKERVHIFRRVRLNWVPNQTIWQKEEPQIQFRFSRVKPSLLRLYEFPWLQGEVGYGSFNTPAVRLRTQFKINHWLPYFGAHFARSDGWRENAGWSDIGMRAGFHYQLRPGHQLSIGTDYRFRQQGVYAELIPSDTETYQTETTFWNWTAELRQQWSEKISSRIGGEFHTDAFWNRTSYSSKGFRADAEGQYRLLPGTVLQAGISWQEEKISFSPGEPFLQTFALVSEVPYHGRLFETQLCVVHRWRMLEIRLGGRYQALEDNTLEEYDSKFETTYTQIQQFYPDGQLTLVPLRQVGFFVAYRPGIHLNTLSRMVRFHPFGDFYGMAASEDQRYWEAGAYLKQNENRYLRLTVRYIRGSHYLIRDYPINIENFRIVNPYSMLPYFGMLDWMTLKELSLRGRWDFLQHLFLKGWIILRKSRIEEWKWGNPLIIGKQVSFIPDLTAGGEVEARFAHGVRIALIPEYVGIRYIDAYNYETLDPFFLLHLKGEVPLYRSLKMVVRLNNILNHSYFRWLGMPEAGFHMWGGIKVEL